VQFGLLLRRASIPAGTAATLVSVFTTAAIQTAAALPTDQLNRIRDGFEARRDRVLTAEIDWCEASWRQVDMKIIGRATSDHSAHGVNRRRRGNAMLNLCWDIKIGAGSVAETLA